MLTMFWLWSDSPVRHGRPNDTDDRNALLLTQSAVGHSPHAVALGREQNKYTASLCGHTVDAGPDDAESYESPDKTSSDAT